MADTIAATEGALLEIVTDPVKSAKAAGLRYVSGRRRGITRERRGDDFVYLAPGKREVTDEETLARIKSLAIPPAWTAVWICPVPEGHIQATGRDAKGRKQYRYHPRWREARDATKYHRMVAFGLALPAIRQRVDRDLRKQGLPRDKVLATVVKLLETTLIRVGNEEYARRNKSFGLTTLRCRHVKVKGSRVEFKFRGKSGLSHIIDVQDRRLTRVIARCHELPGQELFGYLDDQGKRSTISSGDVNEYLREACGEEFTAKDFRTWRGTVLAARALRDIGAFKTKTQAKKNVARAVESVAEALRNTPAVCRKAYIHPAVLGAYLDGYLAADVTEAAELTEGPAPGLSDDEAAVLAFLCGYLAAAA